ncbi:MAG TPA: efflux RND transporter periplasmic adaptor subunit [Terrimicrobiaceae bacterium]|nr:efflux RND transporter periplasmic adaptor subunit [Terrimicrobiaceae bacterium]
MKRSLAKWTVLIALLILIAGGGTWLMMRLIGTGDETAQRGTGERKVLYYRSTMMLGEISQTLRKDSMGMEMVPVYEGEEDTAIKIDPVTTQNMGVRTAEVIRGPVHRSIRTVGRIEFNETAVSEVTTRVPGWIEKLYVDSTGKLVHKGEPLFEFYSPDLYLTEREYLLALVQGEASAAPVLNKLYHLGLSVQQIENLRKTREVPHTLRIDSPRDGVVIEKNALQGTMTEPGKMLYRIGDIGTLWVLADIYEQDLPFLKLGQEAAVKLSYMPDRTFRGKLTYIYPTVDEKTRTARVRMEFPNPGFFLKPGMFVTVDIDAQLAPEAVLVPDMAVLRSGEKNTVFVALEGGKFEPRKVALGARSADDYYQVLSGLEPGERVVTSGQFLLDSESQLREAIQKMLRPQPAASEHASHASHSLGTESPGGERAPPALQKAYVCPMPEHVSILYNAPGKCPICGMTLVEASVQTSQPSSTPAISSQHTQDHAQGDH